MPRRNRYLPLSDVAEGMVLGAPLAVVENGVISLSLPAGLVVNETTLRQLQLRQAEFVCVETDDERSDAEREADVARAEARTDHIFRAANLNEPVARQLYEAVLAFRRQ